MSLFGRKIETIVEVILPYQDEDGKNQNITLKFRQATSAECAEYTKNTNPYTNNGQNPIEIMEEFIYDHLVENEFSNMLDLTYAQLDELRFLIEKIIQGDGKKKITSKTKTYKKY